MTVSVNVAMRTDRGVLRPANEDAVGGDPSHGLVLLADGMGGANAGEVASGLAIDLLVNTLVGERALSNSPPDEQELLDALQKTNLAILQLAGQTPEYHGMGTTLLMGLFQHSNLVYAHVGDSRLYLLRDGCLMQLTQDHTLLEELLICGEFNSVSEALQAGVPSHVLSRAFGVAPEVQVDIARKDCQQDDLFLFCSDGLSNMLSEEEILQILDDLEVDLMTQVDTLVEMACMNGGADNISVILARVTGADWSEE